MWKSVHRLLGILSVCAGCAAPAVATSIPMGFVSWDITIPGSTGQFDIVNLSGANSSVPDWLVTSSLTLSSLSLTVHFTGGGTTVFGPSYFTPNLDGLSFDGGDIAIGGSNPLPTDATLTGAFSTTSVTVDGLGAVTILPTFSVAILPSVGATLSDGDYAVIQVETTGGGGTTPEPSSLLLVALAAALAMKWSTARRPQPALAQARR